MVMIILCMGQLVIPSGIWAGNLKAWLREATQEKDPVTQNWETLVNIAKVDFQEVRLPEEMNWTEMVLLPNE